MANFIAQADEAALQKLFLVNLAHPSTQDILRQIKEAIAREEEERRRQQE